MPTRTKIIAEIGSNHNNDFETAKSLIAAAAQAGADAVKFQLFKAETLACPDHPGYQMYQKYELPRDWMPELIAHARNCGIECSATPCDLEAVVLLDRLNVPWIKIASGDITYEKLIRMAAATGKPLLISTGGAFDSEIYDALQWALSTHVTMMRCTMCYPCKASDANLVSMREWAVESDKFAVGFSDHTLSTVIPAVAVGMGATVIEKHFTLSRDQEGPDHGHSLTPDEFSVMAENIREAEEAMGDSCCPLPCEEPIRQLARRSCYDGQWLRPEKP